MKKLAISLLFLLSSLFHFAQTSDAEKQLIRQTINLYFDGWATGDTLKVGKAMHSTCHLKNYNNGQFVSLSRNEYLSRFKPATRSPNLRTRIISMDVTNNTGSAKVEINTGRDVFTDYFNLIKTNEGWFIVDKVSTRTPQVTGDINLAAARKIDSLFSSYTSATPGAAVAVVMDGKVVFQRGYGMADLSNNIPVTPQTVFNIASVSKQFTAFATYLLAAEGKISLEDDIRKYIPSIPDYGTPIRIKHLLGHTSGLRDQAALGALAGGKAGDVTSTQQVIKLVTKQKQLNFAPGTAFGYCNTGYTLLAVIIERASGQSFTSYTQQKIFRPLGMIHTQFIDDHKKVIINKAESYEKIGAAYFHRPLNSSNPGPSNLVTTVEDLVKWQLNFDSAVVGTHELLKAFNEASYLNNGTKAILRITPDGDTIFHAKGQNLSSYNGVRMITHGGHAAGFRTFMGRFPEERLSVIALSNDEHNEQLNARWQIAEFYIKDKMHEDGRPVNHVAANTANNKTASYPSNLKDFAGNYYSDEVSTGYTMTLRDGKLVMTHLRVDDVVLLRSGKDTFTGSGPDTFAFELEFKRNQAGVVTGFAISNFGVKGLYFGKR